MSTPTSRPPHEQPEEPGLTAADRAAMGQHAAPRPYPPAPTAQPVATGQQSTLPPPPPPPSGTPTQGAPAAAPSTAGQYTAPAPVSSSAPPAQGSGTEHAAPAQVPATTPTATRSERRAEQASDVTLPEPPPKRGVARHLVGLLLGLVLTPVALLLVGIGTARLAEDAGTADMGTDTLGTTLLVLGVVLLAVIILLGVWSPTVPIVGGLVWGIGLGVAYLVIPGTMEESAETALGNRDVPAAVDQLAESAMSGQLVLIGALLLAAGLATARARRSGRRWAEGVAAAERARAEAQTAERDRVRLDADARARGAHPA